MNSRKNRRIEMKLNYTYENANHKEVFFSTKHRRLAIRPVLSHSLWSMMTKNWNSNLTKKMIRQRSRSELANDRYEAIVLWQVLQQHHYRELIVVSYVDDVRSKQKQKKKRLSI